MRRRRLVSAFISTLVCTAPMAAAGQQERFRQRTIGSQVEFDYRYRDLDGRVQDLTFTLPASRVEAAMDSFRDYSLAGLNRYIERSIEAIAAREGIKTRFTMSADGRRSAHFDGPPDRVARLEPRLPTVLERARNEYLGQHLRLHEGDFVYVDYVAAVRDALAVLPPLAEALRRTVTADGERAYARAALAFLQSIPYDDLIDVSRYGGVDFAPAAAMLKLNVGDCDSKAVAMAVLMRLMLPQRSVVVARTRPGTAAIGHVLALADIVGRPGDTVLARGGRSYVALEASGPSPAEPGVVDARIGDNLRRGEVIVVEVGR